MLWKHKKICIEHFLILAFTVTGCISISAFPSLIGIFIRITSSARVLKIYTNASVIKMNMSIIKKKEKKHNKRVWLPKI